MGRMLDGAFAAAGRAADMVLTGHVHDYQRFTRTIGAAQVPYIVAGAGGYHNLHDMARDPSGAKLTAPFRVASDCVLDAFCADRFGFLRLGFTAGRVAGEYVAVDRDGSVTPRTDVFTLDLTSHSVA
jgi:acid phosphatase type 7